MPKRKYKKSGIAPLVETDPLELTDKRLDPAEAVCREREELLKQSAQFKIPGQNELEDPDRSLGPRLSFQELINRLTRISPDLKARDGSAGNIALYYPRTTQELDQVLRDGSAYSSDVFFMFHKYVGGLPKTDIPEYSYVDIDASHLPTREHRGWRSILIGLIKSGATTYDKAVKEFGDPSGDSRSNRWCEQLANYRKDNYARPTANYN
jgi:hypothetical protein